jgi:FkbM family methyltransferase
VTTPVPSESRRPTEPAVADDPQRREAFFDEAASLTPYLAAETSHGELFLIPTDGGKLGKLLFTRQQRKDMNALPESVRLLDEYGLGVDGSTFVDVGANIGTTTVVALRHHPFSRGVALEPSPVNFQTLRLNLTANMLDGAVAAIEAAVTDEEGEQALVLSDISCGKHTLDPQTLHGRAGETVAVKTVTLDGLVARGVIDPDQVGLLWLDAAGGEVNALAGASTLIEAGVPIVTKIRGKLASWPDVKPALEKLLASYTDFAFLHGPGERSKNLSGLLSGARGSADMLAVRL